MSCCSLANGSLANDCSTMHTDEAITRACGHGLSALNKSEDIQSPAIRCLLRTGCQDAGFSFQIQIISVYKMMQTSHAPSTAEYYNENWTLSFWTYLAVRLILDLLRASSLMLFEGAVVAIIKGYGGDYGLQKLFGTAGGILFGPLAGNTVRPICL